MRVRRFFWRQINRRLLYSRHHIVGCGVLCHLKPENSFEGQQQSGFAWNIT